MSRQTSGGFALLEVVVALGLLAISTLVIIEALGAALEYVRAADAARQATAVAAAVAQTYDGRALYPAGWRAVGGPGPDGLPGTADDTPPAAPGWNCRRRIVHAPASPLAWSWFEASCSGLERLAGTPTFDGYGGAAARGVALARPR